MKCGELRSAGGVISIVPFLSFAIVQRYWTQLFIWMELFSVALLTDQAGEMPALSMTQ